MKSLFSLILPVIVMSEFAGIKVGINELAIVEVVKLVENSLTLIPLNNITVNESGTVLLLYNLQMNNTLSLKQESISIIAPGTIQLNFTDLNSIVTFNIAEGRIHSKGNVTFPNSFILLQFEFYTQDGALQADLSQDSNIVLQNCIVTLGSPFNAFAKTIAKEINQQEPIIEGTILGVIAGIFMNTLNPVLYSVAKLLPIPPLKVQLNISMTNEPILEGNYLTLPIRSEYLTYPFRTKFYPFPENQLPSISNSNLPFLMLLSDYALEVPLTLIWSNLNINITTLPSFLPLQLTTDGLAFLLPGLKKQFGSGKPVTIGVSPCKFWGTPINFTIPNGVVDLDLGIRLDFYVNVSSTQTAYGFTLFQQLTTQLFLSESNFTAHLSILKLALLNNTLGPGNVAPVNMAVLDKTLQLLVKTILPVVNALVNTIEIPAPNLPLVSINATNIQLGNHCILLEAAVELDLVDWVNKYFRK